VLEDPVQGSGTLDCRLSLAATLEITQKHSPGRDEAGGRFDPGDKFFEGKPDFFPVLK
jgi:hypothetical protein